MQQGTLLLQLLAVRVQGLALVQEELLRRLLQRMLQLHIVLAQVPMDQQVQRLPMLPQPQELQWQQMRWQQQDWPWLQQARAAALELGTKRSRSI